MRQYFDHERLRVYQASVEFVAWCHGIVEDQRVTGPLRDQLQRAATSIPLNIAEGNGKTSRRDRARFLEIARGSSLECAACLDVLVARELLEARQAEGGKEQLNGIVSMLTGLLRNLSVELGEEDAGYVAERLNGEHEHESE
ncbi:MAG: four helix bundle protein [Candidatus Brocadiia bacterium]